MARKTHFIDGKEQIKYELNISIPREMHHFLVVESKRLAKLNGRPNKAYKPTDVVRALITAYYEKRMAGLWVSPDD